MPESSNFSLDEIKKLLEENLKYTRETFKTVEKIRRHFMMERVYRFIKFVIVIGLLVMSYLTIQPYLEQLIQTYDSLKQTAGQMRNLDPSSLYKQYQDANLLPSLKK